MVCVWMGKVNAVGCRVCHSRLGEYVVRRGGVRCVSCHHREEYERKKLQARMFGEEKGSDPIMITIASTTEAHPVFGPGSAAPWAAEDLPRAPQSLWEEICSTKKSTSTSIATAKPTSVADPEHDS